MEIKVEVVDDSQPADQQLRRFTKDELLHHLVVKPELDEKSVKALTELLERHPEVVSLTLGCCNSYTGSEKKITAVLVSAVSVRISAEAQAAFALTELALEVVSDIFMKQLAPVLQDNRRLKKLHLEFAAAEHNALITYADIKYKYLEPETSLSVYSAAPAVFRTAAKLISANRPIVELSLFEAATVDDCTLIADALKVNVSLHKLQMKVDKDAGKQKLIAAAQFHSSVKLVINFASALAAQAINLSKKQLTTLPDKLNPQITDLNLSRNLLASVPSCLRHLSALKTLDLRNNKITILPPWLGSLPALTKLKAKGNPLTGEQKQLAVKRIGSSKALMKALKSGHDLVPSKRLPVIFLGSTMAGKTALMNCLTSTPPPKQEERTAVVTFTDIESDSKDEASQFSFRLRELPGHTQFHAYNQRFLYTFNTAIAVLVVKLSDRNHVRENGQLRLYLSRLQHAAQLAQEHDPKFEQRTATIIVCTHKDLFLEEKRSTAAELSDWAENALMTMKRDYPLASVVAILLANGKDQSTTREKMMGGLVRLAKAVLKDKTVPRFAEDLHLWFVDEQAKQLRPAWAREADAVNLLVNEGFSDGSASRALESLIEAGDAFRIGSGIVALDPLWLSVAISALVLPPEKPYCGIDEGHGERKLLNGVASFTTLRDRLMEVKLGSGPKARPLVHDQQEAKQLIRWLTALSILVPLDDENNEDGKTRKPDFEPTEYLVPARLVTVAVGCDELRDADCIVARRITFSEPDAARLSAERFSPSLMNLLMSHLRFHSSTAVPHMFGQSQLKLLLGHVGTAFISLDIAHTSVDVVVCGPTALVGAAWPDVFQAVLDVISMQRADKPPLVILELCSECWRRTVQFRWSLGDLAGKVLTTACEVPCETCRHLPISHLYISVYCRDCRLAMCKTCEKSEHESKNRGHNRLSVLRAGHPISSVKDKEKKYFCEQLGEFFSLESIAVPIVSDFKRKESRVELENVRAWSAEQLQLAICGLKPHFTPLFEFELEGLSGEDFLRMQTPLAFAALGVDGRIRREWLAETAQQFALKQRLYDDQLKGPTPGRAVSLLPSPTAALASSPSGSPRQSTPTSSSASSDSETKSGAVDSPREPKRNQTGTCTATDAPAKVDSPPSSPSKERKSRAKPQPGPVVIV